MGRLKFLEVALIAEIHSFTHSGDLYSASSRHYYSERRQNLANGSC